MNRLRPIRTALAVALALSGVGCTVEVHVYPDTGAPDVLDVSEDVTDPDIEVPDTETVPFELTAVSPGVGITDG